MMKGNFVLILGKEVLKSVMNTVGQKKSGNY